MIRVIAISLTILLWFSYFSICPFVFISFHQFLFQLFSVLSLRQIPPIEMLKHDGRNRPFQISCGESQTICTWFYSKHHATQFQIHRQVSKNRYACYMSVHSYIFSHRATMEAKSWVHWALPLFPSWFTSESKHIFTCFTIFMLQRIKIYSCLLSACSRPFYEHEAAAECYRFNFVLYGTIGTEKCVLRNWKMALSFLFDSVAVTTYPPPKTPPLNTFSLAFIHFLLLTFSHSESMNPTMQPSNLLFGSG